MLSTASQLPLAAPMRLRPQDDDARPDINNQGLNGDSHLQITQISQMEQKQKQQGTASLTLLLPFIHA
jgi:hypothetical protein